MFTLNEMKRLRNKRFIISNTAMLALFTSYTVVDNMGIRVHVVNAILGALIYLSFIYRLVKKLDRYNSGTIGSKDLRALVTYEQKILGRETQLNSKHQEKLSLFIGSIFILNFIIADSYTNYRFIREETAPMLLVLATVVCLAMNISMMIQNRRINNVLKEEGQILKDSQLGACITILYSFLMVYAINLVVKSI